MFNKQLSFDIGLCHQIKKIQNHDKVGDHTIYQDPATGIIFFRKSFMTNKKKEGEHLEKKFDERRLNRCDYMMKCLDYNSMIKSDICSKFFIFEVYYEYPFYDLEKILKSRMKEAGKFLHEELMYIFYHVLEALCFLEGQGVGYNNLQLSTVFYETDGQHYKLIDDFSRLAFREKCLNLLYSNKGFNIFAPETLKFLQSFDDRDLDFAKISIYHLGIILLVLGNNCQTYELYDLGSYIVNKKFLNVLLKNMFDSYNKDNPVLIEILKDLLIENPKYRPTPLEVKKKFPNYMEFVKVMERNSNKINPRNARARGMTEYIKSNRDLAKQAEINKKSNLLKNMGQSYF